VIPFTIDFRDSDLYYKSITVKIEYRLLEFASKNLIVKESIVHNPPKGKGKLIVLTAPLTETIDHAGYFIQMGMASMPVWMEGVMDHKYPEWRRVERNPDGTARAMPAGVRLVQKSLEREYGKDDIVACYPDDLHKFIGPRTRVVAVSTHNPMGVTFAAGVYASLFGSSREPINAKYAKVMFDKIKGNPYRDFFKVIVGGPGGWQIIQTDSYEELGIDCVIEGRSESADTLDLFHRAIHGEKLPRRVHAAHPEKRDEILMSDARTTFGVVEMTTGCGRRCHFCNPDLNPQIDLPREKILEGVRANVDEGCKLISLATEDMFIWGQVDTEIPFFFPNREALLDLYSEVVHTPGVEKFVLSHCTLAPIVVDPIMIRELTDILLPKSPIHLPAVSRHPQKKVLSPLAGLETGSIRLAKKMMPSKGAPFSIEDWPSIVLESLRIMNENSWFPMLTLMIGNPGETDEDVMDTLDLVYEMERRGLHAFLIPSVFTPLNDTRMMNERGVSESRQLSPLQWQLILKCWKENLYLGLYSWWGPPAWRFGSFLLWLMKLRKLNGPNFTWPLLMFSGVLPEGTMKRLGRIYPGKPLITKNRKELLSSIRSNYWKHLRPDTGDIPDTFHRTPI
jgi:radical SAM superfamily enzyme YgiQ (UPF0313 family)